MRTIERNFRKNPHTATFLKTFHSGISSTGRDYRAETPVAERDRTMDDAAALAAEANQDEDLLDLVPVDKVADLRTGPQAELMEKLIKQIGEMDLETGCKAASWTMGMTERGLWTPGRQGNASDWITRLIAKERELRQAAARKAPAAPMAEVADGRYAVEHEGVLKFFKVKNGSRPGFVFLDVQASDDWHAIRNVTRIREIVALIAVDADEASLRYGREIGQCGDCGRTLTTEESRARGRGPVCDAKH
jgi:hypothetical protein